MKDPAILRALVLVLLALSIGASARVCVLYAKVFRKLRAAGEHRVGLTPLHVALASFGLLLLECALAWALIASFRQSITVYAAIRTVMYGAGSATMIAALLVIGRVQSRRVKICKNQPHVTVSQTERVDIEEESR